MSDAYRERFTIPGAVTIEPDRLDMPRVLLTHPSGARAELYLHGAHVTGWRLGDGEELLFLSRESAFTPDRPIRGGIPVIFPQFGDGPLPTHGFARTRRWALIRSTQDAVGTVAVALRLEADDATSALWPYQFALTLEVALLERALSLTLTVNNRSDRPFEFATAFHTYFNIADIATARVEGLHGVEYLDKLQHYARQREEAAAIQFTAETDRIYLQTPDIVRLIDPGHQRTIRVEKHRMPDVVVWNPWIDKAQRLPDFGDAEYRQMACVETGVIEPAFELPAGGQWEGETVLRVE
jgi:glucose-6-phosphate 1-epimerase